ncbi:MAG: Co2+/Mg2+ efflux protein ApaG [Nitratireductor sp.]
MYHETTHDIVVSVMPVYIDERSKPEDELYFWAYRVVIENNSKQAFQLLSRYWKISDALGRIEEVRGEGVVGEQPVIEPNGRYEYTSGCTLSTPSGIMVGTFTVCNVGQENQSDTHFEINIPAFSLDLPDAENSLN